MDKKKKKSNNNIRKAIALSYNPEDNAPKIIAKGQGLVAEKILEKAIEEDLPLYKDEDLAENLMKLDIDDTIPIELYEVVAEILVYIHHLDNQRGKGYD